MVQIDIFWSYSFGATYALMASRQLKKAYDDDPTRADREQFHDRSFMYCLLFLSIAFVPSGVWLLWAFPDWETMQVATTHASIPAWFVTLFVMTNITQGILGYWLTRRNIVRGQNYAAYLHLAISNFLFYFVLFYGWDGTGIKRFLSPNQAAFLNWNYDSVFAAEAWKAFITCPVPKVLFGFGVVMVIPFLLFTCIPLVLESGKMEEASLGLSIDPKSPKWRKQAVNTALGYFGAVFLCGVGAAAIASVCLHLLGSLAGAAVFIAVFYLAFLAKWGIVHDSTDRLLWLGKYALNK